MRKNNKNETEVIYEDLIDYLHKMREMLKDTTYEKKVEILRSIYQKSKIASLNLCKDGITEKYTDIAEIIIACEDALQGVYLLDTKSKITERDSIYGADEILDFICSEVRKKILLRYQSSSQSVVCFDDIDVADMCYMASKCVSEVCKKYGFKCKTIRIDPGFNYKKRLFDGRGFHFFNIVQIGSRDYLIDLTYKQFFRIFDRNILSRLGVVGLAGCAPGVYMIQTEERKELAERIIEKGWIEFNYVNIKNYFDGFALSARNGHYYELLGKVDYQTEYTSSDYLRFLFGEDDMFKHEPREGLGRQMKPLKNPYINFEKK